MGKRSSIVGNLNVEGNIEGEKLLINGHIEGKKLLINGQGNITGNLSIGGNAEYKGLPLLEYEIISILE